MDINTYSMLLDTISVSLDCLAAETKDFVPELGTVTQSIWTEKEVMQFKSQLKGLMALIPDPSYFKGTDNG